MVRVRHAEGEQDAGATECGEQFVGPLGRDQDICDHEDANSDDRHRAAARISAW
jgi:hypothetical protein